MQSLAVVVPFYDGTRWLPRLAESLASQELEQVVVVIDDDEPSEAVRSALAGVEGLTVVRTRGGEGTSAARNLGARHVSSRYVTFLDQDDWWPPGFVAELPLPRPGEVVAYDNDLWSETATGSVEPVGETVWGRAGWRLPSVSLAESRVLDYRFPMTKLVLTVGDFRQVGGYRPAVVAVEDFDLNVRLVAAGRVLRFVGRPRGAYLLRRGSITGAVAAGDLGLRVRSHRSWVLIWWFVASRRRFPVVVRALAAYRCARAARVVLLGGLSLAARQVSTRWRGRRDEGATT